jgi:DNA-3-methyladenine glycosylase
VAPAALAVKAPARLAPSFFARPAPQVARDLLGQRLVHVDQGVRRAARVVEAEAYHGSLDRASHAFRGPTPRAGIMFGGAGVAYVYVIYGQHACMNVVTGTPGEPSAVLLRAAEPLEGCLHDPRGPGNLCRALGLTRSRHDGLDLGGATLFFERGGAPAGRVVTTPRVNVEAAGRRWASRRWRFLLAPCDWISGPDRRRYSSQSSSRSRPGRPASPGGGPLWAPVGGGPRRSRDRTTWPL